MGPLAGSLRVQGARIWCLGWHGRFHAGALLTGWAEVYQRVADSARSVSFLNAGAAEREGPAPREHVIHGAVHTYPSLAWHDSSLAECGKARWHVEGRPVR